MNNVLPLLLPYQRTFLKLADEHRCVIVKKCRQSGFTFAIALWAVLERFKKNTNCYYVSRTERTAKQFARYAKLHCQALNIAIQEEIINLNNSTQSIITFPNGNFIQVMPSGIDVVRGLPGSIIMDEASFHEHSQEFFDSSFPTIQAGHSFHIISTMGSPSSFFEQEWQRAVDGNSVFHPFSITMTQAVEQGLANYQKGDHHKFPEGKERNDAFINFLKKGMSQEAYNQEYELIQRGVGSLITSEEYQKQARCETFSTIKELEIHRKKLKQPIGELYIGIDPAFNHDLASIWILEKHYDSSPDILPEHRDIYLTVVHNTWQHTDPRTLYQILRQYIDHPNVCKVLVDQSGVGYSLAFDLTSEFGGIVEPLVISNKKKGEMYERMKYFIQADRIGLPKDHPELMAEFIGITRTISESGTVKYEYRCGANHGDSFASCAYALEASERDKSSVNITTTN